MSECTWVPPVYLWHVTLDHMNVVEVEGTHWIDDGTWVRFYVARPHLTTGRESDHTAIRSMAITMISRMEESSNQYLTPQQD